MGAVQGGLCPEKPFPFHHRAIIIFYEFCDTKSLGSVVCESGCIRSFILSFRKQFLRASLAGGACLVLGKLIQLVSHEEVWEAPAVCRTRETG